MERSTAAQDREGRAEEEEGGGEGTELRGESTEPFKVPLPQPVYSLPCWRSYRDDVFRSSYTLSFAPNATSANIADYFPKAPTTYSLSTEAVSSEKRKQKLPNTSYAEHFAPPRPHHDQVHWRQETPKSWEGLMADPEREEALKSEHWRSSYDKQFQVNPHDLRPYSQHLLRYKTTAPFSSRTLGGTISSGHHVVAIPHHLGRAGVAPDERFVPVRQAAGGRQFIEIRHVETSGGEEELALHPPVALSQYHPKKTDLIHQMIHYDVGQRRGEASREGASSDGARIRSSHVPSIVKNSGMSSTYRSVFGQNFDKAAYIDSLLEKVARRTSKQSHAPVDEVIPAGCGKLDHRQIPQGTFTVPRCFRRDGGIMIEDEHLVQQLRNGTLKVPVGPRAKETKMGELMQMPGD